MPRPPIPTSSCGNARSKKPSRPSVSSPEAKGCPMPVAGISPRRPEPIRNCAASSKRRLGWFGQRDSQSTDWHPPPRLAKVLMGLTRARRTVTREARQSAAGLAAAGGFLGRAEHRHRARPECLDATPGPATCGSATGISVIYVCTSLGAISGNPVTSREARTARRMCMPPERNSALFKIKRSPWAASGQLFAFDVTTRGLFTRYRTAPQK